MPQFLVDATYRTRGGNMARRSTSVSAADMQSAQRETYCVITSRHHGAAKIDFKIVADLLSAGVDRSPAVPGRLATISVQNGGRLHQPVSRHEYPIARTRRRPEKAGELP